MNSEDHIKRAEVLVQSVVEKVREGKANLDVSATILAEAQVHATLAVARATQEATDPYEV